MDTLKPDTEEILLEAKQPEAEKQEAGQLKPEQLKPDGQQTDQQEENRQQRAGQEPNGKEENASSNEREDAVGYRNLSAAIEAILFAMGGSVELERMAAALDVPQKQLQAHIEKMMSRYEAEDSGIRIIRLENAYQMCTKKEYYNTLIRIARVPRRIHLTDVLLETLSIIAYKQPVTKLEIEKIRGVKSDHAVNKLVEYELVAELGRLDAPGRPILFGTTEEFLRHFGVSSLEELPVVDPTAREDFKAEAEKEIDEKLKV